MKKNLMDNIEKINKKWKKSQLIPYTSGLIACFITIHKNKATIILKEEVVDKLKNLREPNFTKIFRKIVETDSFYNCGFLVDSIQNTKGPAIYEGHYLYNKSKLSLKDGDFILEDKLYRKGENETEKEVLQQFLKDAKKYKKRRQ